MYGVGESVEEVDDVVLVDFDVSKVRSFRCLDDTLYHSAMSCCCFTLSCSKVLVDPLVIRFG